MRKEEEKLLKQTARVNAKGREREFQEWQKKSGDDGALKGLEWFLSRSQVGSLQLLPAMRGNLLLLNKPPPGFLLKRDGSVEAGS